MVATMLSRAVAARRTAVTASRLYAQHIPFRARPCTPSTTRRISLIPWRRKERPIDPTLPVYFPTPRSQRRGLMRIRHLLLTTLVLYLCANVYINVVFEPLLDWADSEWESLTEKERKELEDQEEEEGDDGALLFLPAPFTIRTVPQPRYDPRDPDFRQFHTIHNDGKQQGEIKNALAEYVRRGVERDHRVAQMLGGTQKLKINKFWIDIYFPPTPPPLHYVSGLMIEEDAISWGERLIDSHVAHQVNRMLYPKAVAMTAWTFVKVLYARTVDDISQTLGLSSAPPPSPSIIMHDSLAKNMRVVRSSQTQSQSQPRKSSSEEESKSPFFKFLQTSGQNQGPPGPVQIAMSAAMLTFMRHYTLAPVAVPRGSMPVEGIIELQSQRYVMGIYVKAWYDPKQKKFVNVHTVLKHVLAPSKAARPKLDSA